MREEEEGNCEEKEGSGGREGGREGKGGEPTELSLSSRAVSLREVYSESSRA